MSHVLLRLAVLACLCLYVGCDVPSTDGDNVEASTTAATAGGDPPANSTPAGCKCVEYQFCSSTPVVHQEDADCEEFYKGENIIDIRIQNEDCAMLEVCCPHENIILKNYTSCSEPGPDPDAAHHHNTDGVHSCSIEARNGKSEFGDLPWLVAVAIWKGEGEVQYQCGGSLISSRVVLTAGRCVDGHDKLMVRVGAWDTGNNESHSHQLIGVKSVVIHEQYDRTILANDVALLTLATSVQEDPLISPVCLPQPGAVFDHTKCFISGWGREKNGRSDNFEVAPTRRNLAIVPRAQCQADLRKTALGPRFKLDESFICAGGQPGIDACIGDGGSPLVCPLLGNPNKYQQAGIVAWGIGCGGNIPGVYVDVAKLRPWIDCKLAAANPR